jgi:hypothetical protein
MTLRTELSVVLDNDITQPSASTVFLVVDQSTEGNITVSAAQALLGQISQGDPGFTGSTGYTGSFGYTGSAGYTGSVGYTGSTGTQGIRGYTGSTGTQGITGFTGSTGTQGNIGYTGSTGTQGVIGFTGSTGTQGTPGQGVPVGGSTGQILTKQSNTNYDTIWSTPFSGSANTATNIAGGSAGNIPIQNGTSSTTFISTGSTGNLLQYNSSTNTATWVSTSSLLVGNATNSDKIYVSTLGTAEATPVRYITMVAGPNTYAAEGASSNLFYHTNNQILTSPGVRVSSTTSAISTTTGALIVSGGVGIAKDLYVGGNLYATGTIYARQLTIEYTTITYSSTVLDDIVTITTTTNANDSISGALIVSGGVGIAKDLYVGGVIYGTLNGGIDRATNLAGGTVGQIPYQSAANTTLFAGAGTLGQILVSSGASIVGPAFKSTTTIQVGFAVNILGGTAWSIPYQLTPNTTRFLGIGASNTVLTSNGTSFAWVAPSGTTSGRATTATNLDLGTIGQVPFQTGPGKTSFYGPGNSGEILVSAGASITGPVYTSTSSIFVGRASLADRLSGGLLGGIPYQTGPNSTSFIGIGTTGQVLTVGANNTATWQSAGSITVSTASHIAEGSAGAIHIQSAPGRTTFIGTGTVGYVLTMAAGNTATWQAVGGSAGVGYATTASNIAGGGAGRIVYNYGSGQTGFTNAGTAGQILISGGTGSPVWTTTATISAGGTGGTGILSVQGDINATKEITAYYGSDARLKENIKVIEDALGKVRSLNGVMFDWKDSVINEKGGEDGYFVRKHDTGIIAQDVEKVLPEVVATRDDGFLAVRYEKLAGLIIQAINELADQVDEIKKRIQ